ncbi:autophagy modulator [Blomia tropicalis]|nr:autophagy modulator [Blomia tropicalis]
MNIIYRIMSEPESCQSFSYEANREKTQPHDNVSMFEVRWYRTFRVHYIWIVPLLCALVFPFFCVTMYLAATNQNHIEYWAPYISDTGALPPEAGFFDLLMDIAAILVILTGYIRYRQVKYYLDTIARATQIELRSLLRLYHLNLYSMLCLYPCSIGLMLIGNFRTSEIPILHLIGNVLVLGLIVSVLFQILLCRHLWSSMRIESCPTTMSVMLLIGLLTTLLTFIFTYTSFFLAGLNNAFDFNWGLHWTYDKPGYLWHILATITEWFAVAISIPFYFLCLYRRMKSFNQWEKIWN